MSDLDAFLERVRISLTAQFAGAVGAQTVGRYVNEPYVAQHPTAYAEAVLAVYVSGNRDRQRHRQDRAGEREVILFERRSPTVT